MHAYIHTYMLAYIHIMCNVKRIHKSKMIMPYSDFHLKTRRVKYIQLN